MDVFVGGVPDGASNDNLTKFFRGELKAFGIELFLCQKLKGKSCAFLTIPNESKAHQFLSTFGSTSAKGVKVSNRKVLKYMGRQLRISASRNASDPHVINTLHKEAEDRASLKRTKPPKTGPAPQLKHTFDYLDLHCGTWIYHGPKLVFQSLVKDRKNGELIIGRKSLALLTRPSKVSSTQHRVDIFFGSIQTIALGNSRSPTVTLALSEAPRCYKLLTEEAGGGASVETFLAAINLNQKPEPVKKRVSGLSWEHKQVVGTCLVYRITLADPKSIHELGILLRRGPEMPASITWPTAQIPGDSWMTDMGKLVVGIRDLPPNVGFGLRFQLQRLAQNGYLLPSQVLSLFPMTTEILARSGERVACKAVHRMARQLPFAGPEIDGSLFDLGNLQTLLENAEISCKQELKCDDKIMRDHPHLRLIHKVLITPTTSYLEGPESETINRVLRKYPLRTNYFLRVNFTDEDGERIFFGRSVSLEDILHGRFKSLLNGSIIVAGRPFEFLGFSHSSLGNQSCWFMAPFEEQGEKLNARTVIRRLGDFSKLRSPAKCAARIGQAFTDTTGAIKIEREMREQIPDVVRGTRVFSDGVGTVSLALLHRLWAGHPLSGKMRPTLYQIRFAGAKGMIALDNRLSGEILRLRPSMIKFEGSEALDIEVCGSGTKALPMMLNRQYIKIMEDLGVGTDYVMELQHNAVDNLRRVTQSPLNAAAFLEREHIGLAANVSSLIRMLYYVGFDFVEDTFLRGTVELASLTRLRDIKYRSRIPVEDAVMLMGIMDETGILKEGEIYCCTDKFVVEGRVAITRAPALHPGDIQVATAVSVPDDSPLNALHNCVVFSQHGGRDLPSQLSGGDLDGDPYCVIWDPCLIPNQTVEPADYPRVPAKDIGREVTAQDMTEFFIEFMQNDQLGRIALLHLQLADQKLLGTKDPDCIILAGMHSTAVDFSKTSIPVDMCKAPRNNFCRPDFMAPSPRVKIASSISEIEEEAVLNGIEDEIDPVAALDPDQRGYRYYKSTKILGKLYRAIDEQKFHVELQARARELEREHSGEMSFIQRVWHFVERQTKLVQWMHLRDWAADVKEAYESQLLDTIYQFSTHPAHPIHEIEVFVGTIIGKSSGVPSRHTRDILHDMKENFVRNVTFTISCIQKGSDGEDEEQAEALERSVACLAVALERPETITIRQMKQGLESFRYVAAAVCLLEINKMHQVTKASGTW